MVRRFSGEVRNVLEGRLTVGDGRFADLQPKAHNAAVPSSGYARSRLWLGITNVGTWVILATLVLVSGWLSAATVLLAPTELPGDLLKATGLLALGVCFYVLVQAPFDWLGGCLLPRRFQRHCPEPGLYARRWLRGVLSQGCLILSISLLLLISSVWLGRWGMVLMAALVIWALLQFRVLIAARIAPLQWARGTLEIESLKSSLPITLVNSEDEGFTGGVVGVLLPRQHLLPNRWLREIGFDGFKHLRRRRQLAVETGAWRRGRWLAVGFVMIGVVIASLTVPTQLLGTVAGIFHLSCVFTLWSFLGLLTLPTLSRAGVMQVDNRWRQESNDEQELERIVRQLEMWQDGELERPAMVETIFHPIPNFGRRIQEPRGPSPHGYWDAARTAVFLSLAGLGCLSRAVHCNCGRPDLWVFLPTD